MRKVWRFILLSRVIVFSFVGLFAQAAHAAYDRTSSDWDGLSDFVQLAKDEAGAANVVATSSIDYGTLGPQDAVILLHPEGSIDVESLSRFCAKAGASSSSTTSGRATSSSGISRFSASRFPHTRRSS